MNPDRSVSVVVPVYNAKRTIAGTVRSLLALEYDAGRTEVIVVDNASTDGSAEVLAQFSDRIRVICEPRRGRSQARNAGLRAARYPIAAFIDADCTASPDWLSHLVPRLNEPDIGVAGGRIRALRPCNALEEFGERLHDQRLSIEEFRPPYVITSNWASRRDVLLEIGAFDEKLRRAEDCDLSYRIQQAGYRLVYEDRAIVSQRNRSTLPALFGEGFQNGYYSVPVLHKHRAFLRKYDHRPNRLRRYSKLAAHLGLILGGQAAPEGRFEAVFEAGKCAGRICGCIRFGRLEF